VLVIPDTEEVLFVTDAMTTGSAPIEGGNLYFEEAGSGPALVFIHGFSLDSRMWDDQFDYFSDKFRVIRYDLRGFGKSAEVGTETYSHVEDLQRLLKYLKVEKASVVGHSMGGRVAVDFAISYPEMTSSLVPVDSILHGFRFKTWDTGYVWHEGATSGPAAAIAKWLQDPLFAPAQKKKNVALRLNQIVQEYSGWHFVNPNPWRALMPATIDQLHKIAVPTLVLVGEEDLDDFHTIASILEERIPGAKKKSIVGAGHMSNMEKPVVFNQLIREFLQPR